MSGRTNRRYLVAQWFVYESVTFIVAGSFLEKRSQFFLCPLAIPEDCARFLITLQPGRTGGRVVTVLARSSRLVAHKHTERTARCGQT